jgi:hypothetical protein
MRQCTSGAAPGIQTHHLPPRAVIDGRVLVKRGRDLADIHLNAIARYRPAIAFRALAHQSWALEAVLAMLGQHSMKGVQRQAQPVISKEFIAQLLDAELTRAAKFEDQRLLFREDPPAGRSARSAAALLETDDPLGLVASQGRSRDATTTANQASITELFIKPDPAKSRLGVHCALLPFFGVGLWI